MLEIDAYEHAQSCFGVAAGVWRAAPDRHLVGCWIPIGELDAARVGAFVVEGAPVVLRTPRQAFQVYGEGETWALAFAAAERRRVAEIAIVVSASGEVVGVEAAFAALEVEWAKNGSPRAAAVVGRP